MPGLQQYNEKTKLGETTLLKRTEHPPCHRGQWTQLRRLGHGSSLQLDNKHRSHGFYNGFYVCCLVTPVQNHYNNHLHITTITTTIYWFYKSMGFFYMMTSQFDEIPTLRSRCAVFTQNSMFEWSNHSTRFMKQLGSLVFMIGIHNTYIYILYCISSCIYSQIG